MKSLETARVDRRRLIVSSAIIAGAAVVPGSLPRLAHAGSPLETNDPRSVVLASGNPLPSGINPRETQNDAGYEMQVAWSLELGFAWSFTSSLFQAEETVYFASNETIYALDAAIGTELWRFVAPEKGTGLNVVDDVVYFGIPDDHLYAIDAQEGTVNWRFEVSGDCSYPQVLDGVVYFGSGDGYLYALNATDGSELWRFDTPSVVARPVISDGVVYFGSDEAFSVGAVAAADGVQLWEFNPDHGGFGIGSSYPVVADGLVSFQAEGSVFVVDATDGRELWSEGFTKIMSADGYFGTITDFELSDGIVYVTQETYESSIGAFDPRSGNKLWETPAKDVDARHYIVSVDGGVVFVRDSENLFAFDAESGVSIWSSKVADYNAGYGAPIMLDLEDHICVGYSGFVSAIDKTSYEEIWRFIPNELGSIRKVWSRGGLVFCELEYYANSADQHRLIALSLEPVVAALTIGGTARVSETTSLRGGPSPTAVVRADLEPDTLVTLIGESETAGSVEWWPVSVNETGDEGWVEASSLEPVA